MKVTPLLGIFTARQVVKITGVPYSKLDFWAKSGLLRPGISDATGSGSRRLYSREDLFSVRVAWNLRRNGLSGRSLRKAMDFVQQQDLSAVAVEKRGKDVVVKSAQHGSVSALDKPGQLYLSLTEDLSEAIVHVTRELGRAEHLVSPQKNIQRIQKAAAQTSQRRLRRA